MSSNNVFGVPIIANADRGARAAEAYEKMNDGRNLQASAYLQDEKAKFGDGISALSLIYNATGQPITVVTDHDWHGQIFDSYPLIIQNGQWGAFLHTKTPVAVAGSEAAVVYSAQTESDEACHVLIAHDIPYIGGNRAYTNIGKSGQFTDWDDIKNNYLEQAGTVSSAVYQGLVSAASIDVGTSPYFRTVLSFASSTKEFASSA